MAVVKFRMTERQLLLLIMGVSLLAYVAAFLIVGLRQKPRQQEFAKGPVARWMPQETSPQAQSFEYVIADLLDPSLMSLPNAHGFSRELWERRLPAAHRAFEPRTELAFLDAATPSEFQPLLRQASLADAVQLSVEKAPAESEEVVEPEPSPPQAAPDHSVLRVVESIDERSTLQSPELPLIVSDTPLRPTGVRIAVAADGTVRYAVLDRSSGSGAVAAQADAQALESAQRIRFEPRSDGDDKTLTWGVLRFIWATTLPAASINEAKAAAP
jgi:hypothetical protein